MMTLQVENGRRPESSDYVKQKPHYTSHIFLELCMNSQYREIYIPKSPDIYLYICLCWKVKVDSVGSRQVTSTEDLFLLQSKIYEANVTTSRSIQTSSVVLSIMNWYHAILVHYSLFMQAFYL